MPNLFDEEGAGDSPAPNTDAHARVVITAAYAELLVKNGVVSSTTPSIVGLEKARRNAARFARYDVRRFFDALAETGYVIVQKGGLFE